MDQMQYETIQLNKTIGYSADAFEALLDVLGVETRQVRNGTGLYLDCPECGTKGKIHLRCEDTDKGFCSWRCYRCKCQLRWYDSYIGLFRMLLHFQGRDMSPFQIKRFIEEELLGAAFIARPEALGRA